MANEEPDEERYSRKALALVDWILGRAIAGVAPLMGAEALAAEYAADGRYADTSDRVAALTRWEATKNFASGFTTGLGGLPTSLVAVPASLGASWVLQARLAGAIAVLHGHRLEADRVRTLILLAMLGDSAKDVVEQAGLAAGETLDANAIRTLSGRLLIQVNRLVGLRLLRMGGQRGAVGLTKAIPIAGGLVGGSFDAATCVAVGRIADRLFAGMPVEPAARPVRPRPKAATGRKAAPARRKPTTARQKASRRPASPRQRRAPGRKPRAQ